jgi:hypothetical protein
MTPDNWTSTASEALRTGGMEATVVSGELIDVVADRTRLSLRRVGGGYWVYHNTPGGQRGRIASYADLAPAIRDITARAVTDTRKSGARL